eukprot:TRINITY_DN1677_c1_g1_i1.p1 TRINITY_DN1677_c1_g1~~TRINITY_DN1677_c1_g1_i1.p1  ORF type:complete len:425 (-),score=107.58 TRINITY_DN1677_c1_g1_i1:75-1271(-)
MAPKQAIPQYGVGDHVQALYMDGSWYNATIQKDNGNGSWAVVWEDGDTSDNIKRIDKLKLVAKAKAKAKAKAGLAPKAKPKVAPSAPPKQAPPTDTLLAKRTTRAEVVRGVFDTFDRDCDDLLNPVELRAFADSVGFEGDESDWADWYRDTCSEVGANRKLGVDRAQFMMLTKDADDEDLYRLCGKRKPQAAMKHSLALRLLFDLFDRDCDGYLNRVELRRFMDNLDFEGSLADWDERYAQMCRDVGASEKTGIDRSQFSFVAERNATDAELDMLVKDLEAMSEQPIAVDVWSKLKPRGANGRGRLEPPIVDDATGKALEEMVQQREPPAPVQNEDGMPLAPVTSSQLVAQEKAMVVRLDANESELANLRKQLNAQRSPNCAPKIHLRPPKVGPTMVN